MSLLLPVSSKNEGNLEALRRIANGLGGRFYPHAGDAGVHRRPRLRHHHGQVPHLLGVSGTSGNFFTKLWFVLEHLSDAAVAPALTGLLNFGAMLLLRRLAPSVPAAHVVVIVATIFIGLVGGEAAGGDPSQAYFSRYAPADDVAVPSVLAFLPFRPLLLTKPTAMVLDREKAEGAAAEASSPITTWFVKSSAVTMMRKVTACLIEKPAGRPTASLSPAASEENCFRPAMVSRVRASDLCTRPVMAKAARKVRAVLPSTRRGSTMSFALACHGGACPAARFSRSPSEILIGRQPTTDPVD
jgi:hypothetical protein